jgi:hypothetical protein
MTTGKPWGDREIREWFAQQTVQRSYEQDVVTRLKALPPDKFKIEQYGALSFDPDRYPLFCVKSSQWDDSKPSIIITGGVHGYEPSGIMSSLRFLEEIAPQYEGKVNFVVYPCVSPLAYEYNHRWNQNAQDINRQFFPGTTSEEALLLMQSVESLRKHFNVAADLHETNNHDIKLTAERRSRDGEQTEPGDDYIPEGFYLYVTEPKDLELGRKIINAVAQVTPVCKENDIFGEACDNGIVVSNSIPTACQAFMAQHADIAMTTEIYPDKCSQQEAQDGQLAAVRASIEYVLKP